MKAYPEIYKSVFGLIENGVANKKFTAADAAINSALLGAGCRLVGTKFVNGEFVPRDCFEIMIKDQHDDHAKEPEPHYVLHFGYYGYQTEWLYDLYILDVAYCDNHSTIKEGDMFSDQTVIEQEPGHFTVSVRGTFGDYRAREIAQEIARVYAQAMAQALPDYFIVVDEDALNGNYIDSVDPFNI